MEYLGDYFHDWDGDLFGIVYAIAHGAIPCLDVATTYGFGASVMSAKIVNLMGGFDYTRMIALVIVGGDHLFYFMVSFAEAFFSIDLAGFCRHCMRHAHADVQF